MKSPIGSEDWPCSSSSVWTCRFAICAKKTFIITNWKRKKQVNLKKLNQSRSYHHLRSLKALQEGHKVTITCFNRLFSCIIWDPCEYKSTVEEKEIIRKVYSQCQQMLHHTRSTLVSNFSEFLCKNYFLIETYEIDDLNYRITMQSTSNKTSI